MGRAATGLRNVWTTDLVFAVMSCAGFFGLLSLLCDGSAFRLRAFGIAVMYGETFVGMYASFTALCAVSVLGNVGGAIAHKTSHVLSRACLFITAIAGCLPIWGASAPVIHLVSGASVGAILFLSAARIVEYIRDLGNGISMLATISFGMLFASAVRFVASLLSGESLSAVCLALLAACMFAEHPKAELQEAYAESPVPARFFGTQWVVLGGLLICLYMGACTTGATIAGGSMGTMPQLLRERLNVTGMLAGSAVAVGMALMAKPGALARLLPKAPLVYVAIQMVSWFVGTLDNPITAMLMSVLYGGTFALTAIQSGCLLCCWRSGEPVFGSPAVFGCIAGVFFAFVSMLRTVVGDDVTSPLCLVLMVAYIAAAALANGAKAIGVEQGRPVEVRRVRDVAEGSGLSTRETEVLVLLADGFNVPVIAKKLGISENTAKTHTSRIYRKLHVHSREELMDKLLEDDTAVLP